MRRAAEQRSQARRSTAQGSRRPPALRQQNPAVLPPVESIATTPNARGGEFENRRSARRGTARRRLMMFAVRDDATRGGIFSLANRCLGRR